MLSLQYLLLHQARQKAKAIARVADMSLDFSQTSQEESLPIRHHRLCGTRTDVPASSCAISPAAEARGPSSRRPKRPDGLSPYPRSDGLFQGPHVFYKTLILQSPLSLGVIDAMQATVTERHFPEQSLTEVQRPGAPVLPRPTPVSRRPAVSPRRVWGRGSEKTPGSGTHPPDPASSDHTPSETCLGTTRSGHGSHVSGLPSDSTEMHSQ